MFCIFVLLSKVSNLFQKGLTNFQPILMGIFVSIATVKVKLISDFFTWTNKPIRKNVDKQFLCFGLIGRQNSQSLNACSSMTVIKSVVNILYRIVYVGRGMIDMKHIKRNSIFKAWVRYPRRIWDWDPGQNSTLGKCHNAYQILKEGCIQQHGSNNFAHTHALVPMDGVKR